MNHAADARDVGAANLAFARALIDELCCRRRGHRGPLPGFALDAAGAGGRRAAGAAALRPHRRAQRGVPRARASRRPRAARWCSSARRAPPGRTSCRPSPRRATRACRSWCSPRTARPNCARGARRRPWSSARSMPASRAGARRRRARPKACAAALRPRAGAPRRRRGHRSRAGARAPQPAVSRAAGADDDRARGVRAGRRGRGDRVRRLAQAALDGIATLARELRRRSRAACCSSGPTTGMRRSPRRPSALATRSAGPCWPIRPRALRAGTALRDALIHGADLLLRDADSRGGAESRTHRALRRPADQQGDRDLDRAARARPTCGWWIRRRLP